MTLHVKLDSCSRQILNYISGFNYFAFILVFAHLAKWQRGQKMHERLISEDERKIGMKRNVV